ncbi:MAG: carboxypeptidase-like regulatory domain-containing protein [Methanobrevibacter smithii]|uniref:carboxypeptidase-like regulatory domain-containing protein n=3 Tax=Methanobrevibacter smithii TaxID=2173 RepID=UPI001C01D0CA|nr:carboxypeptidase-like regulatory domain-containing protein [Methanobrevibacter smithii]MBT9658192.1 carboxypeptidase regulatory-like domain-containing protein [Methanobrevibacter smithii]
MKNLIFKKQLIILISVFILIAGISAVSANENTTDLHQSMEAYDNNVINTDLEVDDNNIIQPNNTDVKSNVSIDINDFEMYYKNGTKLTGKLLDNNSNPIINQTVSITINGILYNRTTDGNGTFKMNINLDPNVYNFTVAYNGSDIYNSAFKNAKVTVLSVIESYDLVKYYKNESQYYATFLDKQGNPVANNTTVTFNINGVFYTRYTNENGTAKLNINLIPANYIITSIHPNGEKKGRNITVLSTILSKDLVKYYKNESQYYATFLDKQGNPVANNTTVTFNINGVFYTRYTNENGTAKLNINLIPANYIITSIHPDGLQRGNNIFVNKTLITYDISQPCNKTGTATFNAEVLDGQGRPLSNASVTFLIAGKVLTKITDEKGIAFINIKAYPGVYTITTTYNGYSVGKTLEIYNNETGFKRYNLGSNDNGTVYLYKSIGNTSSNVRIAYIIGVHVTENAVHKALFDELTNKSSELNYCYDIYKINVVPIGKPIDDINRMRGQLLGRDYVVPEAIKNNYSLVVDVHSNQGGAYVITNFAFAPAQDNVSKAIATKIINDNPGLQEYFPASQTSPAYVTLPIQRSGTPTVLYETYKYEDYNNVTVPYVDLLIESVDTIFDYIS